MQINQAFISGKLTPEGENRAIIAARAAVSSPLLGLSVSKARGILYNIIGGPDLGMYEFDEASRVIKECASDDAIIIAGNAISEDMMGRIKISVIATGFPETTSPYSLDSSGIYTPNSYTPTPAAAPAASADTHTSSIPKPVVSPGSYPGGNYQTATNSQHNFDNHQSTTPNTTNSSPNSTQQNSSTTNTSSNHAAMRVTTSSIDTPANTSDSFAGAATCPHSTPRPIQLENSSLRQPTRDTEAAMKSSSSYTNSYASSDEDDPYEMPAFLRNR